MWSINGQWLHRSRNNNIELNPHRKLNTQKTVETQPRIISNDPAERKGIQLTEQEKNFLIYKVPH